MRRAIDGQGGSDGVRFRISRGWTRAWLLRAAGCWPAWSAHIAQAQAPPGGGSGGPFTRPLWTEIAITVLLIAAAIYAVGRNSRRQ